MNAFVQANTIIFILFTIDINFLVEALSNYVEIFIRVESLVHLFSQIIDFKLTILLSDVYVLVSIIFELSLLRENYFIVDYLLIADDLSVRFQR